MVGHLIEPSKKKLVSLRSLAGIVGRHRDLAVGLGTASAAVVGTFSYAVARDVNETFGRRLGLSPEEFGATQGVLIAKAAILALLLCAGFTVLFASFAVARVLAKASLLFMSTRHPRLVRWLKYRHKASGRRAHSRISAATVVFAPLVLSLLPMLVLFLVVSGRPFSFLAALVASTGLLTIGMTFAYELTVGQAEVSKRITDVQFGLVGVSSTLALIFAVGTYVGVGTLERQANDRAQSVLNYDFDSNSGVVDIFLVPQAQPARLALLGPNDPLQLCDGHSVPVFLAKSNSDYLVAVYPNRFTKSVGIYRLPREQYTIITGVTPSAACEPVGGVAKP